MHKQLQTLTMVVFFLSAIYQPAGSAAGKWEMDDSQIPFYHPPSLHQDVLIPSEVAQSQSLQLHVEHLTTSREQDQEYAKLHPWPWANYVMYGELQAGTGTKRTSQVIWVHYQFFPYDLIENGLFPVYRAVWDPYRKCVDIVFAQYRILKGLSIELYEVKLTDDLHVTPKDLIGHESDFFPNESKPISTLHTDITHKNVYPSFSKGIQILHLLPEKNSLLVSFDSGQFSFDNVYPSPQSDYFHYWFYSKKWSILDYEEKAPPEPPPVPEELKNR
jgi:hypothetical protein